MFVCCLLFETTLHPSLLCLWMGLGVLDTTRDVESKAISFLFIINTFWQDCVNFENAFCGGIIVYVNNAFHSMTPQNNLRTMPSSIMDVSFNHMKNILFIVEHVVEKIMCTIKSQTNTTPTHVTYNATWCSL